MALPCLGLILVVGIVVDDAIVVIENIYRYIESGLSPKVAAIRGAGEVGWPVVAASLTTICAFGPLMFMSGVTGQFMRIVPVMAILVLIASLFEVFVILPAHVAEWGRTKIRTGDAAGLKISEPSLRGFHPRCPHCRLFRVVCHVFEINSEPIC